MEPYGAQKGRPACTPPCHISPCPLFAHGEGAHVTAELVGIRPRGWRACEWVLVALLAAPVAAAAWADGPTRLFFGPTGVSVRRRKA